MVIRMPLFKILRIYENMISGRWQGLSEVSFYLLKTFCLMELLDENIISN